MPRSNIFVVRGYNTILGRRRRKFLPHGRSFPNQAAGVRCILTGLIRVSSTAGAAPCLVQMRFRAVWASSGLTRSLRS